MSTFIDELCTYVSNNSTLSVGDDLFIGELQFDREGVYMVGTSAGEPDLYVNTRYLSVDFFSRYKDTTTALSKAEELFELLHQLTNISLTNWTIFFAHATGDIEDLDRDIEGGKVIRVSVRFIYKDIDQIS